MSSILTSQLRSRPSRGRAASQVHSGGPAAPSGPLRRFPFVIAALVVTVVAAYALFGGASREPAGGPAVNPWAGERAATQRVPATPSRGAMGLDVSGGSPRRVAARTAP